MTSLNTTQSQNEYIKQIDILPSKTYQSIQSRPTTAQTYKKNSFSTAINSIINEELSSNIIINDKNQIYQSHKTQKGQQTTYLKPENIQKINQNGVIVPFCELMAVRKSNRSKSLGSNLMMTNEGGEIMEDNIKDQIFIRQKQPIKNRVSGASSSSLLQLRKRESTPQRVSIMNSDQKSEPKKTIQVTRPQSSSIMLKGKRSSSIATLQKSNVNKSLQLQGYIRLNKTLSKDEEEDILIREQKLLQSPPKQGSVSDIQNLYKQQGKLINEENKQKSLNEIQDQDFSNNNSICIEEPFSRKEKMDEIRENYYTNLKSLLKIADRDYLILRSKQLFDSSFATMKKVVEDYDTLIKEFRGRIFKLNNENAELETTNEWLKRLNQQLERQKVQMSDNQESLLRQNKDLSVFRESYILMQTKFSNTNLEKFIMNYEILDRKSFEYLTRANNLEDDKCQLERLYREAKDKIKQLQKEVDDSKLKRADLSEPPKQQQKFDFGSRSRGVSPDAKSAKPYYSNEKCLCHSTQKDIIMLSESKLKKDYNQLFNKILDMFNRTLEKQTILSLDGAFHKCNLDDPVDILDTIDKMIQFSNSENLEKEMKKIIIASNKLYKACYDESSAQIFNEQTQYDCELIYNKVLSYVTSLKMNVKTLKNQVASYKLLMKS